MGLNLSKGNMYDFVTHTWNTVKGRCPYGCTYCYMKRWGQQKTMRFDEKELKTNLGKGNFIFVGSSCDLFAEAVPHNWITRTLNHCAGFENKYLFQTKNPGRINENYLPYNSIVCTTIETNRYFPEIMRLAPEPEKRLKDLIALKVRKFITIEPVMDFDIDDLLQILLIPELEQVNIGADSGRNNLPEPSQYKLSTFISVLQDHVKVVLKKNLKRLL